MRLFVSINPPAWICEELGRRGHDLVQAFPGSGLRASGADKIHLTLQFLGEVDPSRLPGIQAAMTGVVLRHRVFELVMAKAGSFSSVIWQGILPSPELLALQKDVALSMSFFVPAKAPPPGAESLFSPHLTLARSSRPLEEPETSCITSYLDRLSAGQTFCVDSVCLMESVLSPQGVRYQVLAGFPLRLSPMR